MRIPFDRAKRERTLAERGLDFRKAREVFAGRTATLPDDRRDYGEQRWVTAGFLGCRMVVVVWTPRGSTRQVISMRYANDKERRHWREPMG